MENFIENLWNGWSFIDLIIFTVLVLIVYFLNEKNKDLQTEYKYSEFQANVDKTKLEKERTICLSLKIQNEKLKHEIDGLKFLVDANEDIIQGFHDKISRKYQPRDSHGHFIKVKKEPEIKVTEWICNTTKYEPHFTKEMAYKQHEFKSTGNDLIWMRAASGIGFLVYKSDFKPVTK